MMFFLQFTREKRLEAILPENNAESAGRGEKLGLAEHGRPPIS
jgi:hypothetical protein